MKFLLPASALFFLCTVAAAQEPPPTLSRDHLLGPVKSVETGRVQYVRDQNKSVEGKRETFQTLRFDERGNRIEATSYRDEAVSERLVYTYDAQGRNTGYDEYNSTLDKSLLRPRRHVYTLDNLGRIAEYVVYDSDGSTGSRFTYKYDKKDRKIEEAFLTSMGKSMGRLVYTYDDAGHNLTQTSYNGDDVVGWQIVNSYDSYGHQIEWLQYQNGIVRYKRLFKYRADGKLAEQETLEFNGSPNTWTSHAPVPGKLVYAYNERERSTEITTYDPEGSLKGKVVRTLDDKGNEIGLARFDQNGSTRNSQLKYELDSHGNWTKKIYLSLPTGAKEPEPSSAEYRTITYYN